jgi:large subunit ribosomal protein L29
MVDIKELLTKWRSASVVDLKLELQELVKQQFKLKMQHAIGELKTTHQLKNIRRNIARILGLLTENGAN